LIRKKFPHKPGPAITEPDGQRLLGSGFTQSPGLSGTAVNLRLEMELDMISKRILKMPF
jgi:hypothetical protein